MVKKRIHKKVPLSIERLDEARAAKGLTLNELAGREDEKDRICDVRTLGRARKNGEINPSLLEEIGKRLDVDPVYLSGTFDKFLNEIEDPEIREVYESEFLNPGKHRYSNHLLEHTDYSKTIEIILSSHGVSSEEYQQQPTEVRDKIEQEIDESIVRILKPFFPYATWAQFIQAGFSFNHMTLTDVLEMLNPALIERGLAADPNKDEDFIRGGEEYEDPFAKKYEH